MDLKTAQFSKLDDNTISVEKVIPETMETQTYDYDFLLSQRDAIQKQADDFAAARQVELDEVNGLISQAEGLGIVSKVNNLNQINETNQVGDAGNSEKLPA